MQLFNIWLQEAKNRFFCPVWFACFVCYIFRYFATLENELRSGGRNTRILCRHANISLPIYNQYVAFLDNGLQTLKTLKKKTLWEEHRANFNYFSTSYGLSLFYGVKEGPTP